MSKNPSRQIHKWFINRTCADGSKISEHLYVKTFNNRRVLMADCVVAAPGKASTDAYTPFLEPDVQEPYLSLPENKEYTDGVVILTPLRDAEEYLQPFAEQLNSLSYPHHLMSVYFAEEGSSDDTYMKGQKIAQQLRAQYGFKNASIFKLPITGNNISRENRHDKSIQISRRSHIAKARNLLTNLALKDEKWILWIDADMIKLRPDIVQQFLFCDKDVMVASTLREIILFKGILSLANYDLNSFNETVVDAIPYRLHTHDFKAAGRAVPIQFVGASVLMLKSNCVRKGLHFPESVIYSPNSLVRGIESEGLGMLARQMGFGVYVLPFLECFHA